MTPPIYYEHFRFKKQPVKLIKELEELSAVFDDFSKQSVESDANKCAAEFEKIIKYCKNLGDMKATFGTKNVHSAI